MVNELAGFRAWAYMIGMPGLLVAAATSALLAGASLLPPNLIWLCYLMPVVLAAARWDLRALPPQWLLLGLQAISSSLSPTIAFGWKTVVTSQRCCCSCLPGLAAPC
jgi:hypothetical protein